MTDFSIQDESLENAFAPADSTPAEATPSVLKSYLSVLVLVGVVGILVLPAAQELIATACSTVADFVVGVLHQLRMWFVYETWTIAG